MGQLGASLGNSNITDPQQARWGDLDASEKGARLLAGGMRGLGQGMQNLGRPQQGGGMPINPMQFVPQSPMPDFLRRAGGINANNPFFYGGP